MAKNAKTQKRKNAKTRKRKNANQNGKHKKNKTNGGFIVVNKGNFNEYTFDADEVASAKAEETRLTEIWEKDRVDKTHPKYMEWYGNKPSLKNVIDNIFSIPEKDKGVAVYALKKKIIEIYGSTVGA